MIGGVVHRLLKLPGVWLLVSLAFLCGIFLIFTSLWIKPYMNGQSALVQGEYDESLENFARAEQRFQGFQPASRFFPDAYAATYANQFYILYQRGEYDALLEKAASSPALAPVHYWTGCALFRRASQVTEVQEQIAWLERAAEEFHSVLELEPANWDAKYNYELSKRLIDELKDEEETPPQILELLIPRPRQGEQPFQQTG